MAKKRPTKKKWAKKKATIKPVKLVAVSQEPDLLPLIKTLAQTRKSPLDKTELLKIIDMVTG
ncbi:MAG: hypothetical protein MRY49_01825 [Candidatus Pacebacteria bacterium]|nr:hypothetical protein [Candidatus Paceibacterota bacterium]